MTDPEIRIFDDGNKEVGVQITGHVLLGHHSNQRLERAAANVVWVGKFLDKTRKEPQKDEYDRPQHRNRGT